MELYFIAFVSAMYHLFLKWVRASKKSDYNIKIFIYKMWISVVSNLIAAGLILYAMGESLFTLFFSTVQVSEDLQVAFTRLAAIIVGYYGSYIFNKLIRNGQESTDKAKYFISAEK